MNRFDKALLPNLGFSLSSLNPIKAIKKGVENVRDIVRKPSELWENPEKGLKAALPGLTAQYYTVPGTEDLAKKAQAELDRSKYAQWVAAAFLNPTLTQYGGEAKWSRENPEHAGPIYATAAVITGAGLFNQAYQPATVGPPAPATAPTFTDSVVNIGKTVGGAYGVSYVSARLQGKDHEEASRIAEQNSVNEATSATLNAGINYLAGSGVNLKPLIEKVGADNVENWLLGKADPQTVAQINRIVGQMRAEGKSDNEIIGELMQSQWFRSIAQREAEKRTHDILYQEGYQQLMSMGYDHNTATRIAKSLADQYAPRNAAYGVQKAINQAPMNFDPKLLFAAAAILIPFLMLRK